MALFVLLLVLLLLLQLLLFVLLAVPAAFIERNDKGLRRSASENDAAFANCCVPVVVLLLLYMDRKARGLRRSVSEKVGGCVAAIGLLLVLLLPAFIERKERGL